MKDFNRKPHLLKLANPAGRSFILKGDGIAWNNPWHFHPEVELLYCIRGRGTNFIGSHISNIEEGEVLLFGKNLPHTRQRDKKYYSRHPDQQPETIVVQFDEHFLGEHIYQLGEFSHVRSLLDSAQRGIKFTSAASERIALELRELQDMNGLPGLLKLLSIIDLMASTKDVVFLNHAKYPVQLHNKDTLRINSVFAFVHEHLHDQIFLNEVAERANLNPAAFCRYFKARTRKSFVEYVNEQRIARACELLTESDHDITQIALSCGFNNLSNFNKQFKKIAKLTPSAYRNSAMQRLIPNGG